MKKVGVISLGCDKNRVDTETMLAYLDGRYKLTQKIEEADIIVVNTCAFINSAREEAIDTILEAKTYGPEKLIVTGCLPQKYAGELFDELIEADAFMGTGSYHRIADLIDELYACGKRINAVESRIIGKENAERIVTTPYHYAYLKIAEGCDNHCTYCTIPSIRGKYTSRKMDSLVAEAEKLVSNGVKELIFVAQDVTRYGEDRGENQLVPLIRRISEIDGIEWIRLLYCYPENVTDELILEFKTNKKLVKYIDIPMQHADSTVLKRMGRRVNADYLKNLVKKLRENIPNISIRSTFIVGFPGETESQFELLCDFLAQQKLDNAGFFEYSMEDGTPAAKLDGQIDDNIKRRRCEKCYELQREVAAEKNRGMVGESVTVLLDGIDYDADAFYGRTAAQAPDIDGRTYISSSEPVEAGKFYCVKITECTDYDLKGVVEG